VRTKRNGLVIRSTKGDPAELRLGPLRSGNSLAEAGNWEGLG
jgi:hypothetical protein